MSGWKIGSVLGGAFFIFGFFYWLLFTVNIDEGHVGVFENYSPFPWGDDGVIEEVFTPGNTSRSWFSTYHEINIRPFEIRTSFDDINTQDNYPIDLNMYAELQIHEDGAFQLIRDFGADWYKHKLKEQWRGEGRAFVNKYRMTDLTAKRETLDEMEKAILHWMRDYLEDQDIPVMVNRITIGKANPPDAVKEERGRTAAEEQRSATEDMRREAEVARKAAETARADADSEYQKKMSFTANQYLRSEELKLQKYQLEILSNAAADSSNRLYWNIGGQQAQPYYQLR